MTATTNHTNLQRLEQLVEHAAQDIVTHIEDLSGSNCNLKLTEYGLGSVWMSGQYRLIMDRVEHLLKLRAVANTLQQKASKTAATGPNYHEAPMDRAEAPKS